MNRIQTLARAGLSHPIVNLFRTLQEIHRIRSDASRLRILPRDRVEDMGITPYTENNQRNSGQYGRLPPAQLW